MTERDLYSDARPVTVTPIEPPARAMTIGAHPDDAEFGSGGTLAAWAAAGTHVTMLVVTDGSKGTWDPEMTQEELIASRMREQRQAAETLGAADVIMLDHVDGELENTAALREELCFWIRSARPNVLFAHDPWKRYMIHPDHRAAGMAAIDAVVAARDHLFFPEQLGDGIEKHRPDTILLWSADEVDHWEDISATFDTKVAALLEHSTQGPTTMGNAHDDEDQLAAFRLRLAEWAATQGEAAGYSKGEAFKRLAP